VFQCHEVKINGRGDISTEMLKANIDDVVAWTFNKRKQNDVHMLSNAACSVSCSDKKGKKKGGKKYNVNEGFELDAKTIAGEVVKPRWVMTELRTVVVACEFNTENFGCKNL